MFTQLIDTVDRSKTFLTKRNIAYQDVVSLNITYSYSKKWYSLFASVNSFYSHYRADFGAGRTIDLNVVSCNLYAQQVFRFAKHYSAEVSAFYSAPTVWQGTFKVKQNGGVDLGLQRTILKDKATLRLGVSDIFKTVPWTGSSNFAGQYLQASSVWESRMLKLGFSYRFGNIKVKASRQRKGGDEDENKRVGSQGGGFYGN
jgi:hypothetical protein